MIQKHIILIEQDLMNFVFLSKLAAIYYRELTPYEIEKCKKDTIVFDGDNCVSNALDFCLKIKEERREKKVLNTTFGYTPLMGSSFDT